MSLGRRHWFKLGAGAVAGGLLMAKGDSTALAQGGVMTFEIYEDAKSEFRWRLKATNGQIIATSGEGYKAKADCKHGIEIIMADAAKAKVVETPKKP